MSYVFVRPPNRHTRTSGRRPMPPRTPVGELNRPLLRQFVRNRRSDPRYEAYVLEVREGPAVNGNTNAAAGKSLPQPWVTVRDSTRGPQSIALPVSLCDTLLKHLLTCAVLDEVVHTDSSDDSDEACPSPSSPTEAQPSSPTLASGDAKSPVEEPTSDDMSVNKKSPTRQQGRRFNLTRLKPVRIVCEATGCTLELTTRDPTQNISNESANESEQSNRNERARRWLISAPLETRPLASSSGEPILESSGLGSSTSSSGRRRHPWESSNVIELHESLMPQLSAFLADVVTRYRTINQFPEIRSLFSASGGRRFFFDLRDTRWGKRLHISQVTEMHRNVIGIPLEALVTFRSRLDTVIQSLGLEGQHALRSTIFPTVKNGASSRTGEQRASNSLRDGSNDGGDSLERGSGGRKSAPAANSTGSGAMHGSVSNRQGGMGRPRGRERRRQRASGMTGGRGGGLQDAPIQNDSGNSKFSNTTVVSGDGVPGGERRLGGGRWGGGSRNRRRPRQRQFNRERKPAPLPAGETEEENEVAPRRSNQTSTGNSAYGSARAPPPAVTTGPTN